MQLRTKLLHCAKLGSTILPLTACAASPFADSYNYYVQRDLGNATTNEHTILERAEQPLSLNTQALEATSAEQYVQLALSRNPSLRAAEQRVRRLQERIPQVTSLKDPRLQVTPIGQLAQTAAGQVSVQTGLSQELPFPGKLKTRGRIAAQDVAIARQDLESVRLTVIADTRRAYWSLYHAVQAIQITRSSSDLLRQLRDVAQAKYRAGTSSQQAVLRASVELNNLENELISLEQRRSTAAAMLNMLIDRPVQSTLPDPARLKLVKFEARLDNLLNSASQTNPSIKAIRERLQKFHEMRKLAELDRYPDLTLAASYNIVDSEGLSGVANGNDQYWLGFGINLPIWQGRIKAAQREATRGILETASTLTDQQNRVAFRVQDAYLTADTQQRQAVLLRDVIVPEARTTVEASLSGYRSGEVDFLTLVDNWRKYLDFQLMYQANLSELERSLAELQQIVGHDLARNTTSTNPAQPADQIPPDTKAETQQ